MLLYSHSFLRPSESSETGKFQVEPNTNLIKESDSLPGRRRRNKVSYLQCKRGTPQTFDPPCVY
jgi:hypothetical protein